MCGAGAMSEGVSIQIAQRLSDKCGSPGCGRREQGAFAHRTVHGRTYQVLLRIPSYAKTRDDDQSVD
jgi:hypothetical protein